MLYNEIYGDTTGMCLCNIIKKYVYDFIEGEYENMLESINESIINNVSIEKCKNNVILYNNYIDINDYFNILKIPPFFRTFAIPKDIQNGHYINVMPHVYIINMNDILYMYSDKVLLEL